MCLCFSGICQKSDWQYIQYYRPNERKHRIFIGGEYGSTGLVPERVHVLQHQLKLALASMFVQRYDEAVARWCPGCRYHLHTRNDVDLRECFVKSDVNFDQVFFYTMLDLRPEEIEDQWRNFCRSSLDSPLGPYDIAYIRNVAELFSNHRNYNDRQFDLFYCFCCGIKRIVLDIMNIQGKSVFLFDSVALQ